MHGAQPGGCCVLGRLPARHEVTHKDGDCLHNEAANLEYLTRFDNQKRFVS